MDGGFVAHIPAGDNDAARCPVFNAPMEEAFHLVT
jgi:hypothetical protein